MPFDWHPGSRENLNPSMQTASSVTWNWENASNPWVVSLGNESIVVKDKVIQVSNQHRKAYDGKSSDEHYIANGEVGLVANGTEGWLNVLFAGRPNLRFGYRSREFPGGAGPLELAYALTVHKSQGS